MQIRVAVSSGIVSPWMVSPPDAFPIVYSFRNAFDRPKIETSIESYCELIEPTTKLVEVLKFVTKFCQLAHSTLFPHLEPESLESDTNSQ